jgi:hypothetical protein
VSVVVHVCIDPALMTENAQPGAEVRTARPTAFGVSEAASATSYDTLRTPLDGTGDTNDEAEAVYPCVFTIAVVMSEAVGSCRSEALALMRAALLMAESDAAPAEDASAATMLLSAGTDVAARIAMTIKATMSSRSENASRCVRVRYSTDPPW